MRMLAVRRASERGFALLLVFLLAGTVALMLYRQLPRVAFETEREREQLLIDRGEQYKRAVQVFFVANKRFPNTLEELDRFQDKRYLRRRYKDPMTGKDEWRLVHSNGMFLTDSLVTKPPEAGTQNAGALPGGALPGSGLPRAATGAPGQGAVPGQAAAAGQAPGQEGPVEVNAAVLRRPSDRLNPEPQGFGGGFPNPGGDTQESYPRFDPNAPISLNQMQRGQNGVPGQIPGQPGLQGTLQPGQFQAGAGVDPFQQPRAGGVQFQPNQAQNPGQFPGQIPGLPPLPGSAPAPPNQPQQFRIDTNGRFVPVEANVGNPAGGQQFRNQNSSVIGPGGPGQPNQAVNLINQLLTTPRQQQPGGAPLPGGITPGAIGIAGVASTSDKPSIKRYKERGKYKEWEFVFDPQQQMQQGQVPGTPQNPLGPGSPAPTGQPAGMFPGLGGPAPAKK